MVADAVGASPSPASAAATHASTSGPPWVSGKSRLSPANPSAQRAQDSAPALAGPRSSSSKMALRKRSADCASRPTASASTVPGERVTSASIARTLNCRSWLSVSARSASRSSSGGAWLAASNATAITGS